MWDIPNNEKKIYLTFDDGPTPEVTQWVLDILKEHGIKATFFCIGNNIEKHPDIFLNIVKDGHAVGNHTFNHLNGWKTAIGHYMDNVAACRQSIISHYKGLHKIQLFRPPYGKITRRQTTEVLEYGYKIIMWDVLSADFDNSITPEKCLRNVTKNVREGSVIIFHDSVKAFANLQYALPKAIGYLKGQGFIFDKIN